MLTALTRLLERPVNDAFHACAVWVSWPMHMAEAELLEADEVASERPCLPEKIGDMALPNLARIDLGGSA